MLHQINSNISSPCNGFCELNHSKNLCKACFRTIAEIISWQNMKDHEKLEVLRRVGERKEKAKHN